MVSANPLKRCILTTYVRILDIRMVSSRCSVRPSRPSSTYASGCTAWKASCVRMDPGACRCRCFGSHYLRVRCSTDANVVALQPANTVHSTLTYQLSAMDDWAPSVALSKVSFASNYFYDVGMCFPKLSMLAFYWNSFPKTQPVLRKAVYAVTAYVCTAYMIILWTDTFYCGTPVSVQWSQEEGACSVFYATTPFYFNFAMDLSSYVFSE
jgi:hypothetical protein